MKKTFVITVEFPDRDYIPTQEFVEVLEEKMEHIGDYFDSNIMDREKGRLKTHVFVFNELKRK